MIPALALEAVEPFSDAVAVRQRVRRLRGVDGAVVEALVDVPPWRFRPETVEVGAGVRDVLAELVCDGLGDLLPAAFGLVDIVTAEPSAGRIDVPTSRAAFQILSIGQT